MNENIDPILRILNPDVWLLTDIVGVGLNLQFQICKFWGYEYQATPLQKARITFLRQTRLSQPDRGKVSMETGAVTGSLWHPGW